PTAVAFATIHTFRRGAIIAIAVFLASGVLFWLALSRRVIKPLERLAEFSQSLREGAAFETLSGSSDMSSLTSRPDQMGLLMRSLTRMQQAIEARLNELSTLLDTSAAVVSTLDQQTVLDRILEQVERLLDVQMSAIFALDEKRGIFRVYASRGMPAWYTERAVINPNEPGSVTMRAIRSGQPIQISDAETNPSFVSYRDRARLAGYRSVLAVPLHAQYTPPAALLVFRPDEHRFSDREIDLLSSFANHATMAIENAALFARSDMRLQEQTRRLEALIQSMQDGLILENLEGQVMYANRTIELLSEMKLETIRGQSVSLLMDQILRYVEDKETICDAIEAAMAGNRSRRLQFSMSTPDKTSYWRLKLFDVTDSDGTLIGRGRILQDITQRYEVDRMKSSLISTVSHELRTPLAAIKGYATTLLAKDVEWDDDSQQEFLHIISAETDHLSGLVNDLLDMSRIEAGNLTVSRAACDLGELVRQAAQRAHPQPGDRLHVLLSPDLPPIFADPKRIEAVLRNLIENAAKYSGDDLPIYVEAKVEETAVIIRVRDEGLGIPPELNHQIFTSFYRVENG
ncbi:MAG: GAF domain-containing protein, partial [Anaerolineales bacterium]|nr:GAF domain-containing protein [Anaerolineales bacterium]